VVYKGTRRHWPLGCKSRWGQHGDSVVVPAPKLGPPSGKVSAGQGMMVGSFSMRGTAIPA